jgi:hypothetical protein
MEKNFRQKKTIRYCWLHTLHTLLTVIQCKQRCTRTLPCNVTVVDLIVVYLTFFCSTSPLKAPNHFKSIQIHM